MIRVTAIGTRTRWRDSDPPTDNVSRMHLTMSHTNGAAAGAVHADVDVLVVDDDDALRSTWAVMLRDEGYSVAVAEDGDVALRFLAEHAVGMILLDLRMPRRDGLSVLEALNARQLVVLVSALSLDEATRAQVHARVVTFLEKPVPPERLLKTVATTLSRTPVNGG